MAVALRGALATQVVSHADRGCQYTSERLARSPIITTWLVRSGAKVCAWDNAAAESFWATMKVERHNRHLWTTRAAAKLAVDDWIERVYTEADATRLWARSAQRRNVRRGEPDHG
jgi:putative transposase